VLAITTNDGSLSEDLMNRALPIRLTPRGDLWRRESPIGNPKHDYLPRHHSQIEAELRRMIERWRAENCPLHEAARHSFSPWAKTIGGILMVNGIEGFLGNVAVRTTADDPVRFALAELASRWPNQWMTASDWAYIARKTGLIKRLVPEADRGSEFCSGRALGIVLTAHRDEQLAVEHEGFRATFRLQKERRRFTEGEQPSTRYRFAAIELVKIPADDEAPSKN
jgi:hypothetical protein